MDEWMGDREMAVMTEIERCCRNVLERVFVFFFGGGGGVQRWGGE